MKILLVNPTAKRYNPESIKWHFFPYSIVYLVNYLKKNNVCDADYFDMVMENEGRLYARIRKEHFDLIGFTSTSESRFDTIDIIRETKVVAPDSRIVVGGHFFSNTAEDALNRLVSMESSKEIKGEAFYYLGKLHEEQKDYTRAVESFEKSVEFGNKDTNLEALFSIGVNYDSLAIYDRAAESFQQVLL